MHNSQKVKLCNTNTCSSRLYSESTVQSDTYDLTLSTLAPVWVSSTLFSIYFLSWWQGDFVQQSRASLVGDHFFYSGDLNGGFRVILEGEIRC